MKIFVSATEVFRCNKSQKNLRRQNSVAATKIFTKFSSAHEAICRCNASPRHVAATCRLVCTDLNPSSTSKMCGTVVIDSVTLFREEAYMLTCLGFVGN